jgi:hypothetical protein
VSPEAISIGASVTDDRACVNTCVNWISGEVACNANSYLCRSGVVTSGISHLSKCLTIDFQCGAPDITLAITRYAEYCSLYEAEVGSVPARVRAITTSVGAAGTGTGTGAILAGSVTSFLHLHLGANIVSLRSFCNEHRLSGDLSFEPQCVTTQFLRHHFSWCRHSFLCQCWRHISLLTLGPFSCYRFNPQTYF